MSYKHLVVEDIIEDLNPQDRSVRIRARVREMEPRTHMMNLSTQEASVLNLMKSLVGKPAMIPCREGMFQGMPFLSFLNDEPVIPLAPGTVSAVVPVSSVVSVPMDKKVS